MKSKIEKMKSSSRKYVMVFYTSMPLNEESIIEFKTSSKDPRLDDYYIRWSEKRGKELSRELNEKVYYGVITNPQEEWGWQ